MNRKFNVNVFDEIYKKDDFRCYAGEMKKTDGDIEYDVEITITTTGFQLVGGKTTINGVMGSYKGKPSIKAFSEDINLHDKETQLRVLENIDGIGYTKAHDVLNAVGDLFEFKKKQDHEIPKIKGFGEKSRIEYFNLIREEISKLENLSIHSELVIKFKGKLNAKKIQKISEKITDISELFENPYHILIDLCEISFIQADTLCLERLHISEENQERLLFLTAYLMKKGLANGNTYIDRESLKEIMNTNNKLLVSDQDKLIDENPQIVVDGIKCYPKKLYKCETEIPIFLSEMISKGFVKVNINEYIDKLQRINNIIYDETQIKAIENIVNNPVSITSGYAGCGKTTILKAALYILKQIGESSRLTAPTGKAARRMSEAIKEQASTLHSYILSPDYFNDVLVIDEFSMVDLELFHVALETMRETGYKRLIIVGDPGQLPSIGNGNVLSNLIESKVISTVELKQIHRQKGSNDIIKVAHMARKQEYFTFDIQSKTFYCKSLHNAKEYKENVLRFYNYLKCKFDNEIDFINNVQIICPIKTGDNGVNELNNFIKSKTNPTKHKFYNFGIGDKVMNTKNNKEKDVYNGEIGKVVEIDNKGFTVYFTTLEKHVEFENSDKDNFILAYACTVHKLQGSEYKYIIMVLDEAAINSMITDSRLLYTGITRGKETCIVLSTTSFINRGFKKNNINKRISHLKERLVQHFA